MSVCILAGRFGSSWGLSKHGLVACLYLSGTASLNDFNTFENCWQICLWKFKCRFQSWHNIVFIVKSHNWLAVVDRMGIFVNVALAWCRFVSYPQYQGRQKRRNFRSIFWYLNNKPIEIVKLSLRVKYDWNSTKILDTSVIISDFVYKLLRLYYKKITVSLGA